MDVSTERAELDLESLSPQLETWCIARLRDAYDPETGLFDRQLRNAKWCETIGTEALTSSCIALIAIHRCKLPVAELKVDLAQALEALVEEADKTEYEGALGLMTWAHAVWQGWTLEELLDRFKTPEGLPKRLTAMEAAWCLSGVAHEYRLSKSERSLRLLEVLASDLLSRQDVGTGLFCHAGADSTLHHRMRSHAANFADQIYPIQALAFAANVLDNPALIRVADHCASTLVALQGDLGQWWWHYHVNRGEVLKHYPVYAVHQHAMAPMALEALAKAGGRDFREAAKHGFEWLLRNESGEALVDNLAGTVWRDLEEKITFAGRMYEAAREVTGHSVQDKHGENLTLNRETRPYEWAWHLYFTATTSPEAPPTQHIF